MVAETKQKKKIGPLKVTFLVQQGCDAEQEKQN
jgi:hypothetical protein